MPKSYVTNIMDIKNSIVQHTTPLKISKISKKKTITILTTTSIYQHLNHHVRRNQYSTWELDGVTALYSRYEQNTTKIPQKNVVLHKIYIPYTYLWGDAHTHGRKIFTQYSGISSCSLGSTDNEPCKSVCDLSPKTTRASGIDSPFSVDLQCRLLAGNHASQVCFILQQDSFYSSVSGHSTILLSWI